MNHIHISTVSVITTVSIVVLTTFFLHMAALRMSASDNPSTAAWGKAIAAGWG
jgi:hypothetical protein